MSRFDHALLLVGLLGAGCARPEEGAPAAGPRGEEPAFEAPAPVLRRLTEAQYLNTITDLFGADIVITTGLEPDERVDGLYSVGASVVTISALGVEEYEAAAFAVAEQALADEAKRAALVPCAPADVVDADCAGTALAELGRRVWRRPLAEEELARLVAVSGTAATTLGDFHEGLVYGVAALLQSPNFLFRVELGEEDPERPGERRFTDWEMASRLSFFLWNTTPDDTLLDAAEAGELSTEAGLAAQVDRLLADDRARAGVRNLFTEVFTLDDLDDLTKDPDVFVHYSDEVAASAKEQTLLDLDALIFEEDGDYRELLTRRRTHLDRKLAAIYDVRAPAREGFAETELPEDGGRRGLLGQVSVLAQFAHPTSSSPTLRGLFVREVLLCQTLPAPPGDVSTVLPEASDESPSLADRLEQHRADPACASCHDLTDPIGLGLENFDGLGSWRDEDNGATVQPAGELDGHAFDDAWELAEAVAAHERLGPCLAETVYAYANGRVLADADDPTLEWHAQGLEEQETSVLFLLRDIATSRAFRAVGEVE